MIKPNYEEWNIINLTSSILKAFWKKSFYNPLAELDYMKDSKNIVLIVIDWLWYKFFEKYGKGTIFEKYFRRSLTTVFLSTTTSAITTLQTWVAPNKHWFVARKTFFKEVWTILKILPYKIRFDGFNINHFQTSKADFIKEKSICQKINCESVVIFPEEIIDEGNKKILTKKILWYTDLDWFFNHIKAELKKTGDRKYIYWYIPYFDSICHEFWIGSQESIKYFELLNNAFINFIDSLKSTNTTILITADHGQINTESQKVIYLKDHKEMEECLTMPLCWEPRVAFCYVKSAKTEQFEKYVNKNLNHCSRLYKSDDIIKEWFFWSGISNPVLQDRLWDYILVMKENYIIKDFIMGEEEKYDIWNHWALSENEMLVPLFVVDK